MGFSLFLRNVPDVADALQRMGAYVEYVSVPLMGFSLFLRDHYGRVLEVTDGFSPSNGIFFVSTCPSPQGEGNQPRCLRFSPSNGIFFVSTSDRRCW